MTRLGAAQGAEFSLGELQAMLRRADSDADGDVDFYELLQLLARQRVERAATLSRSDETPTPRPRWTISGSARAAPTHPIAAAL